MYNSKIIAYILEMQTFSYHYLTDKTNNIHDVMLLCNVDFYLCILHIIVIRQINNIK